MKKKYLPLYYKWAKAGRIPTSGLCICIGDELKLFEPTLEYSQQLFDWVEAPRDWYWGYNGDKFESEGESRSITFSPMRQNIVLFLAAMNNEL